jgi:hypothetical protein
MMVKLFLLFWRREEGLKEKKRWEELERGGETIQTLHVLNSLCPKLLIRHQIKPSDL